YSRIQTRVQLQPVTEHARFAQLITHALKTAGCNHTLLSETGLVFTYSMSCSSA
ncbi:AAA family ATPase, partial [Burkholderia sp. HI2714]